VDYDKQALHHADNKLFIHRAAGVHRSPKMALAVLRAIGFGLDDAMDMIQSRRPVVDFADVYVRSVEEFIRSYQPAQQERG
jgi:hypothetical protein